MIIKHRLTANIVYLYLLTFAKILFPLLTFPYLTRVLSVETYGMVSYVRATIIYMQIFVEFGFGLSAVKDIAKLHEEKSEVGRITGNVIAAKVFLSILAFCVLLGLCYKIPLLSQNMVYVINSFGVVFLSIFILDFLFRGLEEMQLVSLSFILMKGISMLLTFVFVKGDSTVLWIPILDIISSFAAIFFVRYEVKKFGIHIQVTSISDVWKTLKESFIYFISNMATTAFGALNTMLIGFYIPDTKQIAYWSVAMTMISGAQALYNPITGGVYPQMVKNPSIEILRRVFSIFMPIVILGSAFTFFFADKIIWLINGPNYENAAFLLRILTPVLIFSFPAMLIGWPTLGAINQAESVTKTTIITCIFQLTGLVVLILANRFTLLTIAVLRGITEAILLMTRFYCCRKYGVF
ncbi:oligosaccharide flippase family protein [Acidaminococcus fermentans]|uniref:oligosaccharide flippase family protein n=1 Tax=Acidaminococcus fermentans TaxID=905 RepID=UPI002431EF3A|nr:oligosaccharide flippase family protein [Acidaminococcus fermentans]